MAEAIELNFPAGKKSTGEIKNIVEETVRELTKEVNEQDTSNELTPYEIENYYEGDSLGADVLKNKYQIAFSPVSPVRIRITLSKSETKILPSSPFS